MRVWALTVVLHLIASTAHAQSIDDGVAEVGNRYFMREAAVDLLFSDHGDMGQSFSCSGGLGFVVKKSGHYGGLCINDRGVFSVSADTWPRSTQLQVVTVCNHSADNPSHDIPLKFLRDAEIESKEWNVDGKVVGRVRFLGRAGGWFDDVYDNVLWDGDLSGTVAICWIVKRPKQ